MSINSPDRSLKFLYLEKAGYWEFEGFYSRCLDNNVMPDVQKLDYNMQILTRYKIFLHFCLMQVI